MNGKIKAVCKPIYQKIRKNDVLRGVFYHASELYFSLSCLLLGSPHISAQDRENVEKNVTFIYKSFNRRKKAEKLYRSIKRYYPGARVVIADDSREPLVIADMAEGDVILHLPFNSGLCRGLAEALKQVETPYVMRLDDDLLLTPSSNVHDQLAFLQTHQNVDLVAIQMGHRDPEKAAQRYAAIRMNRPLLIPAGTQIDGRTVVYKSPNVYLVRTASLRKLGYDPNIRMIDHHEFFYRAAGSIVCVQDPHSFVMHCHNRFENKEYAGYRNDYAGDVRYISEKHGAQYRAK